MKTITPLGFTFALALAAAQSAAGQATITGPASLVVGQAATVTWTSAPAAACASGVRVALNLGSTVIQLGSAVQLGQGKATISGLSLAAGTQASLSLISLCTGKAVSAPRPVSIVGGATPVPVAAPAAITITPAIRQNIDAACQGVLGMACSTTANYGTTYAAITQQITQGRLAGDSATVMYNYLIPMVQASASWKANVVDNAWRGIGCTGIAPEAQWTPRFGPQLQTYSQLVNLMRQSGCSAASANVAAAAPAAPVVQYLSAQQMAAGYASVWGAASGYAAARTNCPVATGAVSCARADLAAYVAAKGTGILQTIGASVFQAVIGQPVDSAHAQTITQTYRVTWSGADDLQTYMLNNRSSFQSATVLAGLNKQGCLVNASGVALAANEPCGMAFVSASGVQSPGTYSVNLAGKTVTPTGLTGGGLLVNNQGAPVKLAMPNASNWQITAAGQIVAQGGGNIVAQGGGNIVAQGGGNIVAQGGGNIVAQGGGNIVAQGGGNMVAINFAAMDALSAARATGLLDSRGSSVISNDGGSLLASVASLTNIANLIGRTGSNSLISATNANQFVGQNGSAFSNNSPDYGLASVSSSPMAYITGPASWPQGLPLMVTWSATPAATACARGFQISLFGNMPTGSATAINVGKSLIPPQSWPKGSKVPVTLINLCTGAAVSPIYTTTIQ